MRAIILVFLVVVTGLALLYYTPAGSSTSDARAAVLGADTARLAAMMAGDGPKLAQLMSDELVFVHSDARVETKSEYVKNLMAGDTAYADAKTTELQTLQPAPNVVVLIGAQQMRKRLGATWSNINLRFMSVWRREGSEWRMVAWQSARPTGNSVVPPKS